ncbi:helix-turn-helix domain-containing protein [Tepidiforma sp.]|uniref:TetR/AcrR family transcriptional regulator n=1 Tax=Tepidiforma sp. TaxID=2682230 RepID=UPI002ADE0BF2|nr:helix-turn-helix domain-containing protein [Tepidiforma sp.]
MANQPRSVREPQTSEAVATRERILAAARALFAERGFDGTSVRMIANRAGVSDPAVHYYFPSKYDLFRALMVQPDYGVPPRARNLDEAVDVLADMFAWWADNAALVRAVLAQQLRGDQEAVDYLLDGEERYHDEVARILASAGYCGDIAAAADILFHTLSGILWDAVLTYGNEAREVLDQAVFRERVRFTIRRCLNLEPPYGT